MERAPEMSKIFGLQCRRLELDLDAKPTHGFPNFEKKFTSMKKEFVIVTMII